MTARTALLRRIVMHAVGLAALVVLWLLLGSSGAHAEDQPAPEREPEAPSGLLAGAADRALDDVAEPLVRTAAAATTETATKTVRRAGEPVPAARPVVEEVVAPTLESVARTVETTVTRTTERVVAAVDAAETAAPAPTPSVPEAPAPVPAAPAEPAAAESAQPAAAAPAEDGRSAERARPGRRTTSGAGPVLGDAAPQPTAASRVGVVPEPPVAERTAAALELPVAPGGPDAQGAGAVGSAPAGVGIVVLLPGTVAVVPTAAWPVSRVEPQTSSGTVRGLPSCTPD